MRFVERNAVSVSGRGAVPIVFLHGYGCDSGMWRAVLPAFQDDFKAITYDLTGYGRSHTADYDPERYASLEAHADDLIAIIEELDLRDVIAVGHSVSAMTVGLAAKRRPDLISRLVMVCPSPSYVDDGDYVGGFLQEDLHSLLDIVDSNYLGWSRQMAPQFMGAPSQPKLGEELVDSFCRTDPDIARHFAKVTFLHDHRAEVKDIKQPTLILQCHDDVLVPPQVGDWMVANMHDATLTVLEATGHCPHMSAPNRTSDAILTFLHAPAAA
ncbi:Sigma factor SigB regulation protein RsbQ [Rhodobacteraceae bacterium THAF1]|uniref:alpha/beta fold hydrolase n=1 Tax=Palleronia sp. THAF1 TaxID=2587842 RepID=UPI000F3C0BD8|nr:alpha/beta hydrolase [Palleronia sp. THAF1]QFU10029.1 Sigma factor SigB regulation protein RsbQ [Palleronia sp. THAF1]VDC17066.1 Sigma factor SigB regulation protein RsbQ [Rhodobacteraceae bacterium THAF1]